MSQNIPPNVLFFSKKCKTSATFITMCQQYKILKYFQMIDVDEFMFLVDNNDTLIAY